MIIDRFEENFAVIEADDGKVYEIPKELLPEKAKEGSVIEIIVKEKETEDRKNKMKEKMNSLFKV